jgi:hypothetical protein
MALRAGAFAALVGAVISAGVASGAIIVGAANSAVFLYASSTILTEIGTIVGISAYQNAKTQRERNAAVAGIILTWIFFGIAVSATSSGSQAEVLETPRVATYGEMSGTLGDGMQANHLNQNAAYGGVIPKDQGVATPMEGNAITDIGSTHYEFHQAMEKFWAPYRSGGARFGATPTNFEYGNALENALVQGGYSEEEAGFLAAQAAAQRQAYGLGQMDAVPRVPGRLNQKR